jgi:plastocyanin
MTMIHIPKGSGIPPPNWVDFRNLTSPTFHYRNTTVTIGVNNTMEWVNDDNEAHTVTSFQVPTGASTFNSGFVFPGKTFIMTLTVPGVYRYVCVWHNWLAGQIIVKPA